MWKLGKLAVLAAIGFAAYKAYRCVQSETGFFKNDSEETPTEETTGFTPTGDEELPQTE